MSVVPQRPAAAVAALDSLSSAIAPVAASVTAGSAVPTSSIASFSFPTRFPALHLSVHHEHVIIESGDHLRVSAPLWLACHCAAVALKLQRRDLNPDGSLFFPDVLGHALIRCMEFIEFQWPDSFDYASSKIPGPNKSRRAKEILADLPMRPEAEENANTNSSICSFYVVNSIQTLNPDGSSSSTPQLVAVARPNETFEKFLETASSSVLCELASASFYLDIKPLVEMTCRAIANTIKGKSPEEIRTVFNIVNDFTPAEEEQVRQSVLERTMMLPSSVLEEPYDPTGQSAAQALAAHAAQSASLQSWISANQKKREKAKQRLTNNKLAAYPDELEGKEKDDSRNLEDLMNFIEKGGVGAGAAAGRDNKKTAKKKGGNTGNTAGNSNNVAATNAAGLAYNSAQKNGKSSSSPTSNPSSIIPSSNPSQPSPTSNSPSNVNVNAINPSSEAAKKKKKKKKAKKKTVNLTGDGDVGEESESGEEENSPVRPNNAMSAAAAVVAALEAEDAEIEAFRLRLEGAQFDDADSVSPPRPAILDQIRLSPSGLPAPALATQSNRGAEKDDSHSPASNDEMEELHRSQAEIDSKLAGLKRWEDESAQAIRDEAQKYFCSCTNPTAVAQSPAKSRSPPPPKRDFTHFPFPSILSAMETCVECGFLIQGDEFSMEELLDLPPLDAPPENETVENGNVNANANVNLVKEKEAQTSKSSANAAAAAAAAANPVVSNVVTAPLGDVAALKREMEDKLNQLSRSMFDRIGEFERSIVDSQGKWDEAKKKQFFEQWKEREQAMRTEIERTLKL